MHGPGGGAWSRDKERDNVLIYLVHEAACLGDCKVECRVKGTVFVYRKKNISFMLAPACRMASR